MYCRYAVLTSNFYCLAHIFKTLSSQKELSYLGTGCNSNTVIYWINISVKKTRKKYPYPKWIYIWKIQLLVFKSFSSTHNILVVFFSELSATRDVRFELYDTRDPDESKVKHYRDTVHPLGTVPALEIEGREPLIESGAICMYLAELYQKLLPKKDNIADYFK